MKQLPQHLRNQHGTCSKKLPWQELITNSMDFLALLKCILIVSYGFRCQYRTDQPKQSELSIGALKSPPWQEIIPNSMNFLALLPDGSCLGTQNTAAHDHTTCTHAKTRVCAGNVQECARASARGITWSLIGTIVSINPQLTHRRSGRRASQNLRRYRTKTKLSRSCRLLDFQEFNQEGRTWVL